MRLLFGSLAVLATACFGILNFPAGELTPAIESLRPDEVVDMHVHVAGFGYGNSGCFVHPELAEGYKKWFYLRAFGVTEKELQANGDAFLVARLNRLVADSDYLRAVVVLALDGVIRPDGSLDRSLTQAYVPTEFVASETAKYENLLYGASINPNRTDAIERLRAARENGAVLLKWIPPIMHIDPSDQKFIPFYQELVKLNMPLLTHAGQERAFADAIDEYGDPHRLELPLKLGVKVIAAHVATTGAVDEEEMIDRLLPMFARYPNLYTDISSLTQINKLQYLDRALLNRDIGSKMLYGSDWPLQFFPLVSAWLHIDRISIADLQAIEAEDNVFDRDVMLKLALGVSPEVFKQTPGILGLE